MKEQLYNHMEALYPELMEISEDLFYHPELRYQEHRACKKWVEWLRAHQWETETAVGGLDTSFRAEYQTGEGGPSIGLLVEYDALPMGHACGHHLQGAVLLAAADAIRHSDLPGPYRLVIYGTPAEEGGQGKVDMLKNGCFRDIDVALMTHAAPNTTVDIKSLSSITLEAQFIGVTAHEALMPEAVRSGFDALMLAVQGLEFLRGHVKSDVKLMASIQSCPGMPGYQGGQDAAGTFSVRTYQPEDLPGLEERLNSILNGAAMMSGVEVIVKKTRSNIGKLPSYTLNRIIMDNAQQQNAPQLLDYRKQTGGTDFGEVTHVVPGAVSRFPIVAEGKTSHSQDFLDHGTGAPAREGVTIGAKIIAATIWDLLSHPELLEEVRTEFEMRKTEYQERLRNVQ